MTLTLSFFLPMYMLRHTFLVDLVPHGLSPRPFTSSPPNLYGYSHSNTLSGPPQQQQQQQPASLSNNSIQGGGAMLLSQQQQQQQHPSPGNNNMFGSAGSVQLQSMWLQWQLQLANQQAFQQQQHHSSLPPAQVSRFRFLSHRLLVRHAVDAAALS
jgi:hypothetical protein